MQGRLYRSLKLWSFYCDLEESLGTLESARAVYDRILDLRIATPQLVLNYALFLQACAPARHADALGIPMLATCFAAQLNPKSTLPCAGLMTIRALSTVA